MRAAAHVIPEPLPPVGSSTKSLGDLIFADGPPPPESEWVELVRFIAARDEAALRALYRRTHTMVFTLIMRITRDRHATEELTLDVFHDVWRRAGSYNPASGTVVGWVMNQARSRAIDRLRFEGRKKRADRQEGTAQDEACASGPQEVLVLGERQRLLRSALATLTADERRAIETAFFAGLSHAETATQLGLPLGTVKTHIRSGLSKLRALIGESTP